MNNTNRIFAGGVYLLRFLAGFLNVTAILIFSRMIAGHTGALTNIAVEFIEGDFTQMIRLLIVTLSFLFGTIVSGFFFPSKHYDLRLNNGILFIIGGFIIILFGIFNPNSFYLMLFIAFILGFQNAMFVFYRGTVVRTTILTGTITDIGAAIGRRLHGDSSEGWKLYFHIFNLFFYLIGAAMAAGLYFYSSTNIVMVGGVVAIIIGCYFIINDQQYQYAITNYINK